MPHRDQLVVWVRRLRLGAFIGWAGLMVVSGYLPAYGQVRLAAGPVVYLPLISQLNLPSVTACQLPEAAQRGDVGLGFPRYPERMVATGAVRAKVLLVDFSDAPAAETPAQALARITPGAPEFYRAVSYGRLDYQLEPHLAWLRMSRLSTDYGWNGYASLSFGQFRAYLQEAVTLADPAVDFTGVQAVYVLTNPGATAISYGPAFTAVYPGDGLTADGQTILNGTASGLDLLSWGALWLNHEAGHTLGLVDLYAASGDTHRFVGGFSNMGLISGLAPGYLAYERWLLGWLDDTQIFCQQTPAQTVSLTAIEAVGGLKAVMVPTGPTSAVVVESRRPFGEDAALPKAGALVYTVDTAILSGAGPVKVFPDLADKYQAPLASGEQVTVGKVTVQVVEAASLGDVVRVTVAP